MGVVRLRRRDHVSVCLCHAWGCMGAWWRMMPCAHGGLVHGRKDMQATLLVCLGAALLAAVL